MSKKTRTVSNKAGKLMKCDGHMLKKVIEAKGYKCHELSKMLRYCSDYLTTCCRTNKISDVAAKYLMDYKIFPQMYDLEGEIKVGEPNEDKTTAEEHVRGKIYIGEPKEVKIDRDDRNEAARDRLKKRMDMNIRNSTYGIPKPDKDAELETGCWAIYSEKDLRDCIKRTISPNSPMPGSCIHLMDVSQLLKRARVNRVPYDVEDMRNDLLVYASNIDTHPEYWVEFVDRLNLVNEICESRVQRAPFIPTDQDIKRVLNEKYGTLKKGVEGIDYGYGPTPKNTSYCSFYAAGHDIAKGVFKLMQATIDDLKHDPEFKELIKQAVKEAYEEL